MSVAANGEGISEFFHILQRYFHHTRGSLNFIIGIGVRGPKYLNDEATRWLKKV